MKKIVNLTPHVIRLIDGTEIESAGLARVSSTHSDFDSNGVCRVTFGEIQGLPAPEEGTLYVVSALVAQAARRPDVVSPATGHPLAQRDEKGQVKAVPGFVSAA